MKTAVKSVRDGGKLAYKEMKHKIRDNQSRKTFSNKKVNIRRKKILSKEKFRFFNVQFSRIGNIVMH
jgi:hypothetical protein